MYDKERQALRLVADQVAADIEGDFPGIDTSYDLYIEPVGTDLLGVIAMGELYVAVYVWEGGKWILDTTRDALETLDLVKRLRR